MTKYQFRMISAILWLIAANTASDPVMALAWSATALGFGVSLLFSGRSTHVKGEQS